MTTDGVDEGVTVPPPTGTRTRRSLSWRLSVFVASVVTLALTLMVAVSAFAMSRWMTSQIDEDLQGNLHRVSTRMMHAVAGRLDGAALPIPAPSSSGGGAVDPSGVADGSQSGATPDREPQSGAGLQGLDGPGSSEGSLQLISRDGSVTAGVVSDFAVADIGEDDRTTLLQVPADGAGHTVDLGSLGTFRVVSGEVDGGRVVVGQSMSATERTIAMLVAVEGVLALLIAGAAALVGLRWVGREMAPLARVAAVARRIGTRDLQVGRIEPFDRVAPGDARAGSEVGDVGVAFNTMIDNVESALTERVRSERKLRQFVADASHELRTPLASIQGYTQLLQKGSVDEELALSRISSESGRMSGLVEDMLLLARLDAGRELRRGPVDVVPLVVDALSDAHAAGGDHAWSLDLDEDAADTCVVEGDETGIRQVLANLLTNARVHTPAGTHVRVGVHATAGALGGTAEAGVVVIRVADDGPGIPESVRPRIFDRFVRGDTSRTRAGTGSSGLGLSIVVSIVEALDGHVEVETSSEGTAFTVVFPRAGGAQRGRATR